MTSKPTRGRRGTVDTETDEANQTSQNGAGSSLDATMVQKAETMPAGIQSASMAGPNPLTDAVRAAANQGIHKLPVPNNAQAMLAERFIRSAANGAGYGVSIRFTTEDEQRAVSRTDVDNYGEALVVWFTVTTEKSARNRSYTTDEIRQWAAERGQDVPVGQKIPKDVRDAFRQERGLPVR